jgi:RHS repeat-associated protein
MYTAWGEPMFENSNMSGGFDAPYRFNGKELDKETGLGYYGARYYQNRLSTWLSVDPLATDPAQIDKSPYAFTWNNPVNLIDPDGRCPWCIVIAIAAFLTAPNVAVAPTGRPTDAPAIQGARDLQGMWIFSGAALASLPAMSLEAGAAFVAEESLSQITGLPFSPRDVFDIAKTLGRLDTKIVIGNSDKTIVIGQGMDDVEKMSDLVPGTEIFPPSPQAKKQWDDMKKNSGGRVSDDQAKGSLMYKENEVWIREKKAEGYNVIDIGTQQGRKSSTFYDMEKEAIYGK